MCLAAVPVEPRSPSAWSECRAGVSLSPAGQADAAAHAAGSDTWDGRTEVHRAERIPRSEYVQQLDQEDDADPAGGLP